MSFWSKLFSKKEDLANESEVRKETVNAPLMKDEGNLANESDMRKETVDAPLMKDEGNLANESDMRKETVDAPIVSQNVSYDNFYKEPGKSVSLLNNDPAWNKFVQFESDNDEELVARFKRKDFEKYILSTAYQKGLISTKTIEECGGYELKISVNEIITTYLCWANSNEPIIQITAYILNTKIRPGLNRCIFEYSYFVRAPFMGYLSTSSFYQERDKEGGRIYQLYTAQRTRELWPRMPSIFIHDNLQNRPYVTMKFNEYMYDEHFYDGIPFWDWQAEGKSPCIKFDWKIKNFSNVVQGQHVCSIIKNPYGFNRKEYKIDSPVSGIIVMGRNGENKEYSYREGMIINDLFTLYKDRDSLLHWHYLDNEAIKNVDNFEETVSLSWEKVAGRELPLGEDDYIEEGYRGFEMTADSERYIVVSLQVKSNIPYIVFSVNSRVIRLSNGDAIDLLFENDFGEKTVLTFPITRNYVDESFKDVYNISFFCEMSENDIECMRNNNCVSWKVRFGKQPLMSVVGYNESDWCPKEYAGDVFKAYVEDYMNQIEELKEEYPVEFSSSHTAVEELISDKSCYVYLMYDTSNGYFKIGISNNPEYRERTLQSEKPTIEKVCAKEYPNRTIASAIESALHKSYDSKRIRGEWFALDANDVNAIIATLS